MINKKYLYIIPILFFTFIFGVNNVKAYTPNENDIISEHINGKNTITFYLDSADNYVYYYVNGINKCSSFSYKCFSLNDYPYYWISQSESGNILYSTDKFKVDTSTKEVLSNGNTWLNSTNYKGEQRIYSYVHNYFLNSLGNNYNLVGNHTIYDVVDNSVYFSNIPDINITIFSENSVNDLFGHEYISSISYNINFSSFDLTKYKYLYSFNSNEWLEITENDYKLLVKENGIFYIKVTDFEDNYITSSTFTTTGIDGIPPSIVNDINYDVGGITYQNLIKIPISYLYNKDTLNFKSYSLFFLSKSKEDPTSDFYITLLNENEGKEIPLIVDFRENIKDISTYENEDIEQNTGSSGGANSSGGGRHDTFQICEKTSIPYQKTIYNDNTNYYNVLYLRLFDCKYTEKLYLDDFSTTYIYVYYNARIYENLESIVNDYNTNKDNFENSDKSFIDYIKTSLNYFIEPVREIFKLITYFFNGLPSIIRYMFITIFIISVILIIFKLLL